MIVGYIVICEDSFGNTYYGPFEDRETAQDYSDSTEKNCIGHHFVAPLREVNP